MKKNLKDITVALLIVFVLVSVVLQLVGLVVGDFLTCGIGLIFFGFAPGFAIPICLSGCNMNMTGFLLTALAFYVIGIAVGRNWDEFTKE